MTSFQKEVNQKGAFRLPSFKIYFQIVMMGKAELEELLGVIISKLEEHEKRISKLDKKMRPKVDKSVMKVLEEQK